MKNLMLILFLFASSVGNAEVVVFYDSEIDYSRFTGTIVAHSYANDTATLIVSLDGKESAAVLEIPSALVKEDLGQSMTQFKDLLARASQQDSDVDVQVYILENIQTTWYGSDYTDRSIELHILKK